MKIFSLFILFWSYHPALLYGISFLLGIYAYFDASWLFSIPCLILWLPFVITSVKHHFGILKSFSLSLLTFFTAWIYLTAYYPFPALPKEGIFGKIHIHIKTISHQHSWFGNQWLYHCEIKNFISHHSTLNIESCSLPCLIIFREEQVQKYNRPLADQDYWMIGKLIQQENGNYLFKVSFANPWLPVPHSHSLAEQRYQWKKKVTAWIETQLSHSLSASFLAGLATGDFDDFWMRQQFARFGLQHLLAISGFHFAIIASFLSFIFGLAFPRHIKIFLLLFSLASYCLFLGPQASILRAWLMCSFTLTGALIHKSTTALNSLGLALLLILIYDPFIYQGLGFQLSFVTTAAILLLYAPCYKWLIFLLPKKSLQTALTMNTLNQYGYCILSFLRQGLALTLAVNILALPFTLYYFHQFPWMSLLYNLFFPFLTSISMGLLLLGALLSFIPFLAGFIHSINNSYTTFLLQLTYQIPIELDSYVKIDSIDSCWLIVYICLVFTGSVLWYGSSSSRQQQEIFSFI